MTRGTRRIAWLAAAFMLGIAPVACSGFSSEEAQPSSSDGGDAATSASDDATVEGDSGTSDAGVLEQDATIANPCANAPLFCTTFEENEDAGPWPLPFLHLNPKASAVQRVSGVGFESMGAMWSSPIADARRSAVELQKANVPTRVSFRFRAEALGTDYEIFLATFGSTGSVRVLVHQDGAIGFWGGSQKFRSTANILQPGAWVSVVVELRPATARASLISPAVVEHQVPAELGGSIGYLFGPATGASGAPSVYYDNVRLDLLL